MLKVRGLSIESPSSTICIDLSMHVYYNYVYTMQELGNEAK